VLKDGDNLPDEIDDDEYWEPYLEVLHTWYHLCESTVEEATDSWAGMVRHIQIWQAVEETSPDSLSYILEKSWKYKYDAIRLLWNQEVDGYGELMFYNYLSREEMALLENFNPEGRLYEGKFVRNESMNNIGISLGYPSLKEVKEVFNFSWLPSESPDGKWKDLYGFDLYRAESYKPPASAVSNAKKGLELRKEWGRGGLSPSEAKSQGIDSGVTRARKIASGKVSKHDVRRMSAFNRHRKNYRPEKKMPDGGPTAGTIAWLLWGGTSGVNWAKKKSAAMNAESEEFDAEDYNSFTEEMESMIDKYGTLQSYDTSYYDNLMEVSFAFRPHNPYFDDVDFDAEVVESWDAEDGDFVWVLILDSDHFEDVLGGVFTSKDEAIEVFSDYLRSIGGDPDGINWDYDAMVWGHDEEDDPSLGEHSIRLYQEKLNDPDFSKYYAAEDVYVHGDDGEARSIRVNKTHARNMSNLSEGSTTTVKDQRKGTQHTVKRVGKGFDLAAEGGKPKLPRPKKTFFGRKPVLVKVGLPCHPDSPNHPKIQKFVADYGGHLENDETFWEGVWVMLVSGNESQGTGYINNTPVNPEYLLGQLIEWDDDTEEVHIIEATTPESLGWMKGDFDAESNDTVWLVNSAFDGTWEEAQAFRNQSDARRRFDEIIDELGGDPSEVETGVVPPHHGRFDWSGDGGFRRAVMYQVTIQDSMGAEGGMKCNFCEEEMDSIAYDTWHGGYCSGYCCDMGYEQATGGSSPSSHS